MKANFSMMWSRDRALFSGLMEKFTQASGSTVRNMALECWQQKEAKVLQLWEFGKMANLLMSSPRKKLSNSSSSNFMTRRKRKKQKMKMKSTYIISIINYKARLTKIIFTMAQLLMKASTLNSNLITMNFMASLKTINMARGMSQVRGVQMMTIRKKKRQKN